MYRFLTILTPEDVQAIAAQLYAECSCCTGYTSVAEFHYLHNAPDGSHYADKAELSHRINAAAGDAGIGLTLLPVLYCHSQFGGAAPTDGQRRFILSLDDYADLCADVADGVAPHSLRAVTPDELNTAIVIAGDRPIHIHIAEQQQKEVADCLAWNGARPVAWLLDHAPVDERWCLVHATHIDSIECARLAASRAIAGLCQTTEANLGDGSFPLRDYLAGGGRFGIGSDANVGTSPIEELRWLDYIRRLETRSRNVTTNLYTRARGGGAQALGREAGSIAPGQYADLVVLDTEHPRLVGRSGDRLLDAWLFSGNSTPVRHVMVAGPLGSCAMARISRSNGSPPPSHALCTGWPARSDSQGASITALHATGNDGGWCGFAGCGGTFNWAIGNHHCNVASQLSPAGCGGISTQSR